MSDLRPSAAEPASAALNHVISAAGKAEKRWVSGASIGWALVITAAKLAVGITTHSLGIMSEALHSSLDLVASAITFFSVRVADEPADNVHQYGHEKVESLSAFVQTALLMATCIWIVYEAIGRLLFHPVDIEPSFWAFAVMTLSMIIDFARSRALMRVARKYNSQALEADALHFSSDVWSSLVVIFGLILVWLGRHYNAPDLQVADPLAA